MGSQKDSEALFLQQVNEAIAPYTVQHCVGGGGVGDIYVAESIALNPRRVAVKTLKEEVTDPLLIQRFRLEYDLLNRLDHPSIAKVFEYYASDRPFFTMEYIEGEDLKSAYEVRGFGSKESRLFEWLIPVCFQLLDALRYLHQRKIIHRDLKPQNVMVLNDGTVKLLDFGIARDQDSHLVLTQHHEILGTFEYIAPEILMGKSYDHRVDLYSLGAFLYQFVGRKRMFEVHSLVDMFREKTTSESPEIPPEKYSGYEWFITFINRLTRRVPSQRFMSSGEALTWLKDFRGESDLVGDVTLSNVASPMLTIRSAPLVERDSLIMAMSLFLDQMDDAPLFVRGNSGSGKTRLAQQMVSDCAQRGIPVVMIDSSRFTGQKPFLHFVWEQLQLHFMKTGQTFTDLVEGASAVEFCEQLESMMAQDRLVIVFDDVHQLPNSGLISILNFFLSGNAMPKKLLLQWMFTFNDEFAQNLEIRGNLLCDLIPRSKTLALEELGVDGVMHLAAHLLENRPITRELAQEILAHANGLPYGVANVLDVLLENEMLHFRDGEWVLSEDEETGTIPGFLQIAKKAIDEKVSSLEPIAKDVLKWMAISGMRLTHELLSQLIDIHPAALDHALNELFLDQIVEMNEGLLNLHDPNLGRHILETLEPYELEDLHRKLLEVLEQTEVAQDGAQFLKLLRHATQANDKDKMFYYSRKLGAFFFNNGMYEEAQQYLANAIANYEGSPRTALFEAYFAKGEAELCLFRLVEAFADFKSAHDLLDLIEFPSADPKAHANMFRRIVLHKMYLVDMKRRRVADAYKHLDGVKAIHKMLAGRTFKESELDLEFNVRCPSWANIFLPSQNQDQISQNFFKMCFDTLLEQDHRGVFVGRMAKNWTWNAQDRTLTFDIKANLEYANGARLRLEDLVFSVSMMKQQAYYNPVLFLASARIEKCEINKLNQFVVTYADQHGPNYSFWAECPIIPAYQYLHTHQTSHLNEEKAMVGSGPYKFQSHVDGVKRFKRVGKTGLPIIQLVSNTENVSQAFASDQLHLGLLQQNEWLQLTPKHQIQMGLVRDYTVSNQHLRMCFKLGPTSYFSLKIRRALYDALQLEHWNSLFFNNAFVVVRDQLIPTQSHVGVSKVTARGEDRLESVMEQEGWKRNLQGKWEKNGEIFTLNLLSMQDSPIMVAVEAMAKNWREFGFLVKVAHKPLSEFHQFMVHPKVNCWIDCVFLDPEYEGIGDLLHSSGTKSGSNIINYKSPEMDQAVLNLEHTHIVQRKASIIKVNKIFFNDLPWLPLYQPKMFYAYSVQLGGVSITSKGLFHAQSQISGLHKI